MDWNQSVIKQILYRDTAFNQAESYESYTSFEREDGYAMMKLLDLVRGIKVLDLGCGTGYFSKILSDLVGPEGTVVGIDPDEERLKVAREKHTASNLKYLNEIAENIPGTDYDLIFSNHVIHWCMDKDLVFKQVHKSLKKGGKFAFTCMLSAKLADIVSEGTHSKEAIQASRDTIYLTSVSKFKQIAESNSFIVNQCGTMQKDYIYKDVEALIISYKIHFKLDETHFNYEALKKKFGQGEIKIEEQVVYFVLTKL